MMDNSSFSNARGKRRTASGATVDTSSSMTASSSSSSSLSSVPDILIVEPFYCGSHRQLVECLVRDGTIGPRVHLVTMSGKKWHWRARVSPLHLTSAIPVNHRFRVLFSSSVLNLAELVALRPDLAGVHKVLYFHENQLQYPVRKHKDRDFQYGYNQILSCLVADCVLFNSAFNMESFLTSITSFLKLMPDYRPKGLADTLRPKCSVVHFPMQYPCPFLPHTPNQQRQSSRTMPSSCQAFPAEFSCGGMHQNAGRAACVSSADMQAENTERDQVTEPRDVQMETCGDTVLQAAKAPSCASFKPPADCSDDRAESLHPQATEGRMDAQLAADNMDISDSHLKFQGGDSGGDHDFRSPTTHRGEASSSSVHASSSVKRSFSPCVPKEEVSSETSSLCTATMTPSVMHLHRRVEDQPSVGQNLAPSRKEKDGPLHIVWPHRWEHDKDPETFFQTLFRLQDEKLPFVVSVLGETFTDVPDIFAEGERRLKGRVLCWGYQADKSAYLHTLQQADVVVSTAKHEFFGVAMLEAVYLGCYPLCPKALVYPELYPDECLYSTPNQLYKRLRAFCLHPHLARQKTPQMDLQRFSWENLRPVFLSKLQINS